MHKKWGYQNLSSAKDLMPSFVIQVRKMSWIHQEWWWFPLSTLKKKLLALEINSTLLKLPLIDYFTGFKSI
jgi:hypothetical protein